jgi:beta-glucosidase
MGHQSVGIQTSSKHYIANEQETQRSDEVLEDGSVVEGISSNIDDRTLHELYLWPFAEAVKAGTTSIMCSYNRLNMTYTCEHPHLLNGILRKELGFRGFVISDWFATHSTAEAANAGLDMEQPGDLPPGASTSFSGGGYFGSKLEAAVLAGNVTEDRLDTMVRNIMTPYFLFGQDDPSYPTPDQDLSFLLGTTNAGWDSPRVQELGFPSAGRNVQGDHAELIRKMGASATVLLKNRDGRLPIKNSRANGRIANIGVFGNAAIDPTEGLVYLDNGRPAGPEFGALSIGGGAGSGRNPYLVSPLDSIKARARDSDALVQYISDNKALANGDFRSIYPIPDICLVFLKTWAAEEQDRLSFELDWNSTLVVEKTARFCGANKTVVITNSAGVNTMPWANNPNVTAILATHFPGHEIGNSIVDVLWGETEPSGRLPYTVPKNGSDYGFPVVNLTKPDGRRETDSIKWQVSFNEGQLIDYRHFDANKIEPLYEFGFGLGYTTFELVSDIQVTRLTEGNMSDLPSKDARIEPGGNADLWTELLRVSVKVKNTGRRQGTTVIQLYLSSPAGGEKTPIRALRGFEKVGLKGKSSTHVEFTLRRRDLSYWDVERQQWRIPQGEFRAAVGFSSRDLPLETTFSLLG